MLPLSPGELVSINPSDGSIAGSVKTTTLGELDEKIRRVGHAFHHSGWKSLLPHRRASVLNAIADGLAAEKVSLATLQMKDKGKPFPECPRLAGAAFGTF